MLLEMATSTVAHSHGCLYCVFRYTSLYLMWSLYLRVDNPYPKKLYVATTILGRLGQEVLYAITYAFILLALCLSWFIGMTRFWDNVSLCTSG